MKIVVSQVSEEQGLRLEPVFAEGEPGLRSRDCRTVGSPDLKLRVARKGGNVRLTGALRSRISVPCARCLTATNVEVDELFDLSYVPATEQGGMSEDHELGEDDLQVAFYQGDEIDLDDVVRERLELALPMALYCKEDCRGLCPDCGANLNEGDCVCVYESPDSRWAALKELKELKS